MRQSILDTSSAHQRAVEERRLQAVDDLWKGLLVLKRHGAWPASVLSFLKMEEIVVELTDPRMQKFIDVMFTSLPAAVEEMGKDPDLRRAQQVQLWGPPMAWATFAAYEAVVGMVLFQAHSLRLGLDPRQYYNEGKVNELVDLVLQDKGPKLTPLQNAVLPNLLGHLESRLFDELRGSMSGDQADRQTAGRAKRASDLAAEVSTEIRKGQVISAAQAPESKGGSQ